MKPNEYKDLNISFGNALYNARKAKGLTQLEVANLCYISPSYISEIENGHKSPTVQTLLLICDGLEIDRVEFFCSVVDIEE